MQLHSPLLISYLELHGRVLLILWRGVALVVEVVGGGGVNDGRLLRRLMDTLTVDVDQEGQQPRPEETGNTGGDEVDGGECWGTRKMFVKAQHTLSLPTSLALRTSQISDILN